ncbi:MAG: phenylalanine--tRNA ligase subunit beta [Bacillota bacterium]|nr:phenylalanine--tRNA ligase subunit beta [Bacillota bacterium]
MLLSLNWLRDYVDLPEGLTTDELAHDLTMRTVEVESVTPADAGLENVVAGRIVKVSKHPDADLLRVVEVDCGAAGSRQIVCGGVNLAPEQMVVVALPGARVRWHGEGEPVLIRETKLRGVASSGMICAASELGLEVLFPDPEGVTGPLIMDLEGFDAEPGAQLADVLELRDTVLEIDNKSLTNRPDLWGHYGIARELAAIYGLRLEALPVFELPEEIADYDVRIQAPDGCRRYVGAVYEGVRVEPAPFWMRRRLWLAGQRPINLLVDLTNYVMLATGQPTHGFDRDHVRGGIRVRRAVAGESLTLLDGAELELDPTDLVIADHVEPLALAGIMGGARDSILPETDAMILEVANFEARGVRRTATRVEHRTEASTRFEKAVDTQRVDQALALAHHLLCELLPGCRLVAFGDAETAVTERARVEVSYDYLGRRLGRAITAEEVAGTLEPLGFFCEDLGKSMQVTAPCWRSTGDISLPADILEEVARMIGYENFPYQVPRFAVEAAVRQPGVTLERRVAEYLAFRAGMNEVYTYPWVEDQLIAAFGMEGEEWLTIASPPAPDQARVRRSLLPGLFGAVARNLRHEDAFGIFEIGQVFAPGTVTPPHSDERLPQQARHVALALTAPIGAAGTPQTARAAETLLRELRGVIERLPRVVQCEPLDLAVRGERPAWADPQAWLVILGADGEQLGELGLVSLGAMQQTGVRRAAVAMAWLNLEQLRALPSRDNSYQPLPHYPEVEEDLSIVVPSEVSWAQIEAVVRPLVRRLQFMEEYRGEQVAEGHKSVMFRFHLGSDEGTLSAEEIDARRARILKKLEQSYGAVLRS